VPFSFRRSAPGRSAGTPSFDSPRPRVHGWTGTESLKRVADRIWSKVLVESKHRFEIEFVSGPDDAPAQPSDVRVLHLFGTAADVGTDISFEVAREGSTRLSQLAASSATSVLTRAEDLWLRFPDLRLCIVQGEPRQLLPRRTVSDRRDAQLARLFAADLFRRGAMRIVVVIPPLPTGLAEAVASEVASACLRYESDGVDAFLRACTRARGIILSTSELGGDTRIECAFDVCVYAAGD
jgi:hypothetical protein